MARPKEIFKKSKKKIKRIPFYENHKVWTSVSIKFYWTQPCSFAYILSTAVFLLQQQRWVVTTKTICTLKPKIFLSGPSEKKSLPTSSISKQQQKYPTRRIPQQKYLFPFPVSTLSLIQPQVRNPFPLTNCKYSLRTLQSTHHSSHFDSAGQNHTWAQCRGEKKKLDVNKEEKERKRKESGGGEKGKQMYKEICSKEENP